MEASDVLGRWLPTTIAFRDNGGREVDLHPVGLADDGGGAHHVAEWSGHPSRGCRPAYDIRVDDQWRAREVQVHHDTVAGPRSRVLTSDGLGRWTVDGVAAPHLDGLVDVDLESSACTNTLPVHRLTLPQDEVVTASAVFVQALDLEVRRLDQTYRRLDGHRFDYRSEGGFAAVLVYDSAALVLDYPGIATRFA